MRIVFELEMRVASYWRDDVLKPVQASVVNGAPLSVPSIFSSMKRPLSSARIVEVPFVAMRAGLEKERHLDVPGAGHDGEARVFGTGLNGGDARDRRDRHDGDKRREEKPTNAGRGHHATPSETWRPAGRARPATGGDARGGR
jgi:hypothetical protein